MCDSFATLPPSSTDIAILGAGPIGLDAALAVAKTGRDFALLEAGAVPGAGIRQWGQVRLFSPWSMNLSDRMRAALAHDVPPASDLIPKDVLTSEQCPTANELCDLALDPIARSKSIRGHLHCNTRVVAVGREDLIKREEIGTEHRAKQAFRLLLDTSEGERILNANTVLDCTGSQHKPLWLGNGGIPAPGETALSKDGSGRLLRTLAEVFDLLDETERSDSLRSQRVLLVGAGHSAQAAAVAFSRAGAHVVWVVRGAGDIAPINDDPLPERSALQAQAQLLLTGANARFEIHRHSTVDQLNAGKEGDSITATLRTVDARRKNATFSQHTVDRIVALVGAVGDHSLYRELQVQECYATSGPMRLAAALLGEADPENPGDCLAQVSQGPETLLTPEPGYFILGNKSYGRNSAFLLRIGYQQVDDVLALL